MDPSPTLQRRGSRLVSMALALVSVLLATPLCQQRNPFIEGFEARVYHLRFRSLRAPIPVHPDIAIIAIDDRSIAALRRFPWTRQQYVHLLNRLEATRRRAILPDVFFPAPESSGLDQALADVLRRLGPAELATAFEIDRRLRDISLLESLPVLGSAAAGVGHINLIPRGRRR